MDDKRKSVCISHKSVRKVFSMFLKKPMPSGQRGVSAWRSRVGLADPQILQAIQCNLGHVNEKIRQDQTVPQLTSRYLRLCNDLYDFFLFFPCSNTCGRVSHDMYEGTSGWEGVAITHSAQEIIDPRAYDMKNFLNVHGYS